MLKIIVSGLESTAAQSFIRKAGTLSGPVVSFGFNLLIAEKTSCSVRLLIIICELAISAISGSWTLEFDTGR